MIQIGKQKKWQEGDEIPKSLEDVVNEDSNQTIATQAMCKRLQELCMLDTGDNFSLKISV
jgi:hypothetical protein